MIKLQYFHTVDKHFSGLLHEVSVHTGAYNCIIFALIWNIQELKHWRMLLFQSADCQKECT